MPVEWNTRSVDRAMRPKDRYLRLDVMPVDIDKGYDPVYNAVKRLFPRVLVTVADEYLTIEWPWGQIDRYVYPQSIWHWRKSFKGGIKMLPITLHMMRT